MVLSSGQFEEIMQRVQATTLKCRKCGSAFTFEQGGMAAIDADIHNKVMCPSCGVVYETDVQLDGIELRLDGETDRFQIS